MSEKNILVAYFSWGTHTEKVANQICEQLGADIFEIKPKIPYPAGYQPTVDQAKVELREQKRPELAEHVDSMDSYDTVIIGFPVWCGTMPMPVYTFLEEYDFKGKKILPFVTHGGGGQYNTVADISETLHKNGICKALVVSDSQVNKEETRENISNWLYQAGITD